MRRRYISITFEGKVLARAPMIHAPTYKRTRKKRSRKLRNIQAELKKQNQIISALIIK